MDTNDNLRRIADRHEATAARNLKAATQALTALREALARIDATSDLTASHADAVDAQQAAGNLQWCIRRAIYAYRDLELAETDLHRHNHG